MKMRGTFKILAEMVKASSFADLTLEAQIFFWPLASRGKAHMEQVRDYEWVGQVHLLDHHGFFLLPVRPTSKKNLKRALAHWTMVTMTDWGNISQAGKKSCTWTCGLYLNFVLCCDACKEKLSDED